MPHGSHPAACQVPALSTDCDRQKPDGQGLHASPDQLSGAPQPAQAAPRIGQDRDRKQPLLWRHRKTAMILPHMPKQCTLPVSLIKKSAGDGGCSWGSHVRSFSNSGIARPPSNNDRMSCRYGGSAAFPWRSRSTIPGRSRAGPLVPVCAARQVQQENIRQR